MIRSSPPNPARAGTYRLDRSYEWNYAHGPVWAGELPVVPDTPAKRFFGCEVASRLGISAGLLSIRAGSGSDARCGFDILTYKTVRSRARACYAKPNWLFVDPADSRKLDSPRCAVHALARPAAGDYDRLDQHGVVRHALARPRAVDGRRRAARRLIGPRQVLVVSVVASVAAGDGADIVRDFRDLAAMAREAGAQLVEANLSCPNVRSAEGELFNDAELSGRIARALRQGAGTLPVLLKIGHLEDDARLAALLRAVAGPASGLVIVNGLSRPVLGLAGKPAFGASRPQAGILGRGVHAIGVRDVARALALIRRERLDLEVAGVGGIAGAADAARYFEAGACAALMGSAPMFDPALAVRLKAAHPEW